MSTIGDNVKEVLHKVEKARKRSINGEEVTIIAVTKTHDNQVIQDVKDLGFTSIGENKVQELVKRMEVFEDSLEYHMIGRLQSNKVKYIYDKVALIHSLDRHSLAKEIDKRGRNSEITVPCLIQVNVSKEKTKGGVFPEDLESFVEECLKYKNIRIMGLMTMAPHIDDEKKLRSYFQKMYKMREIIAKKGYNELDMKYLSMGMSNDYEIAIEEGANMVRIGSSLFGKRDYSKL
ncbi:MAG: YggS family pyridoxal phosphate-dependent enzyme [Tissierellia bacterium]|nr:YggS family pyridoxal phosphate-dependent enzyme [Tissierellia bacterium]